MLDTIHQFQNAMREYGLNPPETITAGQLHRFAGIDKKRGNKSAWCKLFDDGKGGTFGDFSSGLSANWQANSGHEFTPEEKKAFAEKCAAERKQREIEERKKHEAAAKRALEILQSANGGDPTQHPYYLKKGVNLGDKIKRGAWIQNGWTDAMLIPIYDVNDEITSLEAINTDGTKAFLKGGKKSGCFHPLGKIRGAKRVLIGEGIATVAAVCEALDVPAAVAMDAGNLLPVAQAIRKLCPNAEIILLADNDIKPDSSVNVGIDYATKAAQAVNGRVAIPELDGKKCDWWDIWHERGADTVRAAFDQMDDSQPEAKEPSKPLDESNLDDNYRLLLSALKTIPLNATSDKHRAADIIGYGLNHSDSRLNRDIARSLAAEWDRLTGGDSCTVFDKADPDYHSTRPVTTGSIYKLAKQHGWTGEMPWSEPQPLTAKITPEPYPLDALPDTIREAVAEVAAFVKAPIPMIASCALSAVSLACQALVDVKRLEKLTSPISLFTLTIADSGERKTTCDGFFTSAIRQWEHEQTELAAPLVKDYTADMAAWVAQRDGLLSAIKDNAKKGKDAAALRDDLRLLEHQQPEVPKIPRLILGDETPENLAYTLAKKWPSAGVLSSEAGVIFGAHGMGKDSVMRNLALLNLLWDGGQLSIGRRTSESFTVKDCRLTVGLQIQQSTLKAFFDKSGELARGTGFLARFLVAWPESTQGFRQIGYDHDSGTFPKLAAFHQAIRQVLDAPLPLDDGQLRPAMLNLSQNAKIAWIDYFNEIEAELKNGGELFDVRDVASKTADNACRIAALFHVLEHGASGAIDAETFDGASCIALWHLSESRRFFGELALPVEMANAARLDAWLLDYCKREGVNEIARREAQRLSPIRNKDSLNHALSELQELDRVRLTSEGKRKVIKINPALLEGGSNGTV